MLILQAIVVLVSCCLGLSSTQLANASMVRLTLYTDTGLTMYFESEAHTKVKTATLALSQEKHVFLSKGTTKKHLLNLTSYPDNISKTDVNLGVEVYSGRPEVVVYFDESGWPRL